MHKGYPQSVDADALKQFQRAYEGSKSGRVSTLLANPVTSLTATAIDLWADWVASETQANLVYAQLAARVDDTLTRKAGNAIYAKKMSDTTMTWKTGASEDMNASANMTATDFEDITITPTWQRASTHINDEMRMEYGDSIIAETRKSLAYHAAKKIDTTIITDLENKTNGSTYDGTQATNKRVYNAGADETALGTGDTLNWDEVCEGIGLMEDDEFEPTHIVIHPKQKKHLKKMDDFVHADKIGTTIHANGFYGKLDGKPVLTTTQIPAYTNATDSWGADGRYVHMVNKPNAFVHGIAKRLALSYEYDKGSQNHRIFIDMKFKGAVPIQEKAFGVIAVTDA